MIYDIILEISQIICQYLIDCFLFQVLPVQKNSWKFIYKLLSNPANRQQINWQANHPDTNITSLAKAHTRICIIYTARMKGLRLIITRLRLQVYLKALHNVSKARSLVSIAGPTADHHVADGRRTGAWNLQSSAGRHYVNNLKVGPAWVRHVAEWVHLPQQHAERPANHIARFCTTHNFPLCDYILYTPLNS